MREGEKLYFPRYLGIYTTESLKICTQPRWMGVHVYRTRKEQANTPTLKVVGKVNFHGKDENDRGERPINCRTSVARLSYYIKH